ncbi:hypothetical protein MMA231_02894 [Asticcacaulis sp. MM231]|uniref:hypothetical protein n=1 Tax=Asticcacaulis sp. MM231 TaxID=3157666 RepID=UPI0032D5AC7C
MSHTRRLTVDEINALPAGLAAVIPLDRVRLVSRHHWVSWLAQLIGRGTQIVVRGRKVFWPRLLPDVSAHPLAMSLLAHELVHVWQYENGLTLWRYILRERGQYHYCIDGRAYTDYGYEQQAAMVEDWMRLRAGLKPRYGDGVDIQGLEALVPFVKQETPPPSGYA